MSLPLTGPIFWNTGRTCWLISTSNFKQWWLDRPPDLCLWIRLLRNVRPSFSATWLCATCRSNFHQWRWCFSIADDGNGDAVWFIVVVLVSDGMWGQDPEWDRYNGYYWRLCDVVLCQHVWVADTCQWFGELFQWSWWVAPTGAGKWFIDSCEAW